MFLKFVKKKSPYPGGRGSMVMGMRRVYIIDQSFDHAAVLRCSMNHSQGTLPYLVSSVFTSLFGNTCIHSPGKKNLWVIFFPVCMEICFASSIVIGRVYVWLILFHISKKRKLFLYCRGAGIEPEALYSFSSAVCIGLALYHRPSFK